MSEEREHQSWTDWVKRQREDPETTTGQLIRAGVRLEIALIITMLGKIHEELATLADADQDDGGWRG